MKHLEHLEHLIHAEIVSNCPDFNNLVQRTKAARKLLMPVLMTTTLEKHKSHHSNSPMTTKEELILSHLNVVKRLAAQTHRKLNGAAEYEDLLGYAYEGLIVAANRYDQDQSASFLTFAYKRILGCMYDGIGKSARFSRGISRNRNEAECEDLYAKAHYQIESKENFAETRMIENEVHTLLRKTIKSLPEQKRPNY